MTMAVYRSAHPDVLKHWQDTASAEAHNAWREHVETTLANLGFPGRRFAIQGENRVIGVEYPLDQPDQPVPDGWRRDQKLRTAIVPARRTALGKKIGDRLDKLGRPNPRHTLPGGMPEMAFSGLALMHPGVERHGDIVYVSWSGELKGGDADRIDPAVWEQIRLSEYHTVLEAEQDAAGQAGAA